VFEIETARLRPRQSIACDLEAYARIYANPECARYSPKGAVPLEQPKEAFQAAYNYFTLLPVALWKRLDCTTQKMPEFMV